jgi:hypothetical protein
MKTFHVTILIVIFLFPCLNGINAQESFTSTGGNATGTGGNVSYTIGQVSYITNTSSSGTVAQGVQQPYEILVVTGLEEAKDIILELFVYPNPVSDILKLKVESYSLENLSYQLYDANGNLLLNGEIVDKETVINTGDLAPAAYFLQIIDNNKDVKIFKIIKN